DEVVRSTRGLVVSEVDLDELAAALGRRVDRRLVDLAQGTLGERREDADLLDLVAEELDPERLATGGRKDVDEPPAHGELAPLLDPFGPLVAGRGEVLRQRGDAGLVALREAKRCWSSTRRRHSLGHRRGRRAHEPARGEHLERPRPLADE